jgi:AcrR family transcriptional regulator
MSTAYESMGRTQQKQRTRAALIAAARDLVARGVTPTVEEAAVVAGISRTTAYRYFPNQRAIVVAAHPEVEAQSLLPDVAPQDVHARLDAVIDAFTRQNIENELQQRTMLRLSLEPDSDRDEPLLLRQGRAIGWIEDALAPLHGTMPAAALRRLAIAIRSAVGIEALVWLTDMAGCSRDEAAELMRWSAQAMLRAALDDLETT